MICLAVSLVTGFMFLHLSAMHVGFTYVQVYYQNTIFEGNACFHGNVLLPNDGCKCGPACSFVCSGHCLLELSRQFIIML